MNSRLFKIVGLDLTPVANLQTLKVEQPKSRVPSTDRRANRRAN